MNMRLVVQRVSEASVEIEGKINGQIKQGFMVLVGITNDDNEEIVDKMINKLINLRIFEDENEKLNLSLMDIKGEILSISQFTLYANCKKGRRPSFLDAAKPGISKPLYEYFNKALEVDPSYSAARKAVKSARTQGVLQAISQSLAAVSNALNGAVNNVTTSGGLPSSYTAYSTSSLNKVNSTKRSIPCSLCHGTGKNPTKERPAFYSYNEETYSNSPCSVCGDRSNHYHKDCPSCGGKGELLK